MKKPKPKKTYVWQIYYSMPDWPGKYTVIKWASKAGAALEQVGDASVFNSLDEARQSISAPIGLNRISRDDEFVPVGNNYAPVETWLPV